MPLHLKKLPKYRTALINVHISLRATYWQKFNTHRRHYQSLGKWAHTQRAAQITTDDEKRQIIIPDFQSCCTHCIAELLYFIFFVTAVTDHALRSIWLKDLIPLISFSGDSSHDNRRWVKITQYILFSFDLKMRNPLRHGALISIMSRKWIDAPSCDFPSFSFSLYVFTVLWHRLNLETGPSKNATSLQWYRTVSALWAVLSSLWSFLTLSF